MGKSSFIRVIRAVYLFSFVSGLILLALGGFIQPARTFAAPSQQTAGPGHVDVAPFKLPITPISAQYYDRLIDAAENDGAVALVIQLDTPGGLVDSMQEMVKRTLASHVPVIVYVSPEGAMAASAGVFIVYASHVAAMAPNTSIGSAQVLLENGSSGDSSTPESGDAAALRQKVTNLLVTQIRNLAEQRGRNADFGAKAVTQSENYGTQTALKEKVIDIAAIDVQDLLKQADGRQVTVAGNDKVTLNTRNATINELSTNFVEEILLLLTNPSVAFVLISLGTLGITWEFINPGAVFPGVIGAIMLLIGFLALGTLPINAAGIVFMALAFILFIADVFMPSHGVLTAGGIASLVIGGLLLVNTNAAPGLPGVSPYTVTGVAAALGGFFFFAVYKVFQARRKPATTGREGLLGSIAEARTDLDPSGMVYINGELWHAVSSDGPIPAGRHVRVVAAQGLELIVSGQLSATASPTPDPRPLTPDPQKESM